MTISNCYGVCWIGSKKELCKKNPRFSASKKLRSKNPDDTCVTLVLSQLLSNIHLVMIIKYLLEKKLQFLKYPQIFLRWSIRQIRLYLRTDRQTVKICTRCHFREFIDYPAIHCCWSCAFHTKKTDLCEEKCNLNSLSRRHISGKHNSKFNMGEYKYISPTHQNHSKIPRNEKNTTPTPEYGEKYSSGLVCGKLTVTVTPPLAIYCISCCCW